MILGGLVVAPFFWKWFGLLDKFIPGASFSNVMRKTLVNQLVVTFPINMGFLTWSTQLERVLSLNEESRKAAENRDILKEFEKKIPEFHKFLFSLDSRERIKFSSLSSPLSSLPYRRDKYVPSRSLPQYCFFFN